MQQTVLIILVGVLLVLLAALTTLLLLTWRRQNRCHDLLEHLVDEVSDRQMLRSERLVGRLTSQYKLAEPAAKELSTVLFAAEKLYISHFIEQQMAPSVDGFYDNLCELLDSYLKAIPVRVIENSNFDKIATTLESENGDTEQNGVANDSKTSGAVSSVKD